MTVVHIVEPFVSGIAVFVRLLAESMPKDRHIIVHGERAHVMSASEVKKDFSGLNVSFIRWKSAQRSVHPIKDTLALTELITILRRLKKGGRVDAVHLHSSKSGILGRLACRLTGIHNVFYTPNGASFLAAKNGFTRFLYKRLEKIGDRLGGRVVCCSLSELNQYLKIGIEAEYINNGIGISDRQTAVTPKTNGIFRIVASGRIEEQKNPSLFNEIASYFEDLEQFQFIWIGDGKYKSKFTAKNIKVTGWLSTGEVHDIVASADLYLSTSKYEGLSFAVLEALALRKPVLLSNCTGNNDVVKKGINGGLFTTPYDAIVKILQYYNNREMLPLMGEYSKDICSAEFDVKQNFKTYRELYTGSISNPGSIAKWSFG